MDEEHWTEDMTIESLFGHLCSGKNFAHDREMAQAKTRCAALPKEPDKEGPTEDSHPSTQRSVDSPVSQDDEPSPIDKTFTDESSKRPITSWSGSDHGRVPKRQRVLDASKVGDALAEATLQKRKMSICQAEAAKALEKSFNKWLGGDAIAHADTAVGTILFLDGATDERPWREPSRTQSYSIYAVNSTASNHAGPRSTEISDEYTQDSFETAHAAFSQQSSEIHQSQTEISIADSAFESQDSVHPRVAQVERRKEAYQAAKRENGQAWAMFSPTSSGNVHGPEMELR